MWGRHRDVTKQGKSQMLDDMEHVTGLNRKSIIRILNGRLSRKKRTKDRGPSYGIEVKNAHFLCVHVQTGLHTTQVGIPIGNKLTFKLSTKKGEL
jgi:hypothetical protein